MSAGIWKLLFLLACLQRCSLVLAGDKREQQQQQQRRAQTEDDEQRRRMVDVLGVAMLLTNPTHKGRDRLERARATVQLFAANVMTATRCRM